MQKIKEARDKNEEVIKVVEEMKKAGVKTLRDKEWQIEEGLVLKKGRVYVLKVLDMVHTRVEVHRIDLEISRLVEQSWLQLMCCAICLLCGCNFRCWEEVQEESEC